MKAMILNVLFTFVLGLVLVSGTAQFTNGALVSFTRRIIAAGPICKGVGTPAGVSGCDHRKPFCPKGQKNCNVWPKQTGVNPPPITGCSCQ